MATSQGAARNVSAASVRPMRRSTQRYGGGCRAGAAWPTPAGAVIAVMTLVALGLRAYQLFDPGYLLGITEYDDGSASAAPSTGARHPALPRLRVRAAAGDHAADDPRRLAGEGGRNRWRLAIGRILTMIVSAAGVLLLGLLVRHRGLATTILACGLLAVYPDSVAPRARCCWSRGWCCSAWLGALAVFDRDRVTDSRRRLILGGLALGFSGAIEAWAILPAIRPPGALPAQCAAGRHPPGRDGGRVSRPGRCRSPRSTSGASSGIWSWRRWRPAGRGGTDPDLVPLQGDVRAQQRPDQPLRRASWPP